MDQLAAASVENRRMTGVGIFVDLLISKKAARVNQINTEISEGYRTLLDAPRDLVGFTLFIREGYLSFLEGYTFGDVKWPAEPMEKWLLLVEDNKHAAEMSSDTEKVMPKPAAPSLTDTERRKLEAQLREQLRQDCDEARRIGYNPALFLVMMSRHGPVEACRQVVVASKIPDGFMRLLELGRLELTAEATILRGAWRALFSEAVLEQAQSRLIAYGRKDLAIHH
jgi:hypothetical protein